MREERTNDLGEKKKVCVKSEGQQLAPKQAKPGGWLVDITVLNLSRKLVALPSWTPIKVYRPKPFPKRGCQIFLFKIFLFCFIHTIVFTNMYTFILISYI